MTGTLAIRNGTVLDGTGSPPLVADVLIEGDRVRRVGDAGPAETEIDASGRYVAPGFIDIHSHSDFTLLIDPRAVSAVHQGITLEVIGNCGHGCFPIRDPTSAARAIYGFDATVSARWESAAEYFDILDSVRPAVNVLSLVPNGQLRLAVVGLADRPARDDELRAMTQLLEDALEQGAWGYSTGLEYAQERGASEGEITALAAATARRGGLYATHTRRRDAGAAEAVEEAVRTAQLADARLQVSHLVPRSGLAESHRCAAVVEAAFTAGLDVAFDMHTRLYGTTFLHTVLPPSILAAPPDEQERLLRDAGTQREIRSFESILSTGGDWGRIVLLDNDVAPESARKDIASLAREAEVDPIQLICDLLASALPDTARLMVVNHCHTELQQREAFTHPLCMPGSDATTLAPDGPLARSTFHGAYTWAAWYYRFTTQERLLRPEEAVRRLTAVPAARLGLSDRGVLRAGAAADVVVFDPDSLAEVGTLYEPNQVARGVDHVFVNGIVTLRDGELTGERAGRVLRKT